MKKVHLISGALASLMIVSGAASITSASAGEWRHGPYGPYYQRGDRLSPGAAAAIGVLGGLAVGSAIAASQSPVYVAPAPVYRAPRRVVIEEECFVERRREWVPGWGWQVHKRTVCE